MDKLIIVTEIQGYMTMSLKERFNKEGLETELVKASIKEIKDKSAGATAYLIYADENLTTAKAAELTYLKDTALENNLLVFAVGDKEELEVIKSYIPEHQIKAQYLRPINAAELVTAVIENLENDGKQAKKKILVVDDSGAMLRNVKGWLGDKYDVILANSGTTAIKYMSTSTPDLVLLDYEMPIINGKQVLEMIRSDNDFSSVPVIFLTSKNDRESVLEVMSLKPEGYLLKTMEPEKIVAEVDGFFVKLRLKEMTKG
ncbi:MAG: response regulator [Lachnospiraceae bacterium]|nr:response regulator [Lachnospiraceae bacterium]